MSETNGIPELEDVINRMATDLGNYSKSGNANPQYLEIQNKLIEELVHINNNYMGLQHYKLWSHIEDRMAEIETKDKSVNAHHIKIITGASDYPFSSFTFKISKQ